MARTFTRRRSMRTAPILIGLFMSLAIAVAPSAQATGARRAAAVPVVTTAISYRFDAQIVPGSKVGPGLHGWLGGSMDSTGVLTATLTVAGLVPLLPGCAAYSDFGPGCGLPASANVRGTTTGHGASATAALTAVGKNWTWILAGAAAGATGQWTGTLTQGGTYAGTWSLTPEPLMVHIDVGARSDAKSKEKVVLNGAINLQATADGRAIGTYSPTNNAYPTIVEGFVNADKSSVTVAVPMGTKGMVLMTGWSRPGFGFLRWTGTFAGPKTGDHGVWLGQG